MLSSPLYDPDAGIASFICHPERRSAAAHYYRQIMISQRRQASPVHLTGRLHKKLTLIRTPWKS
jgi:hypothetical protein